jgi:hypothetical protein
MSLVPNKDKFCCTVPLTGQCERFDENAKIDSETKCYETAKSCEQSCRIVPKEITDLIYDFMPFVVPPASGESKDVITTKFGVYERQELETLTDIDRKLDTAYALSFEGKDAEERDTPSPEFLYWKEGMVNVLQNLKLTVQGARYLIRKAFQIIDFLDTRIPRNWGDATDQETIDLLNDLLQAFQRLFQPFVQQLFKLDVVQDIFMIILQPLNEQIRFTYIARVFFDRLFPIQREKENELKSQFIDVFAPVVKAIESALLEVSELDPVKIDAFKSLLTVTHFFTGRMADLWKILLLETIMNKPVLWIYLPAFEGFVLNDHPELFKTIVFETIPRFAYERDSADQSAKHYYALRAYKYFVFGFDQNRLKVPGDLTVRFPELAQECLLRTDPGLAAVFELQREIRVADFDIRSLQKFLKTWDWKILEADPSEDDRMYEWQHAPLILAERKEYTHPYNEEEKKQWIWLVIQAEINFLIGRIKAFQQDFLRLSRLLEPDTFYLLDRAQTFGTRLYWDVNNIPRGIVKNAWLHANHNYEREWKELQAKINAALRMPVKSGGCSNLVDRLF